MGAKEYPQWPRIAVGALVFKQNRVLLVKRAKPPSQGRWAIPGGMVNLGESLEDAVRREIFEETNLDITVREPVYTFDVIEKDPSGRIRFHYVIIDFAADYVSGQIAFGDDAADARWVSLDELEQLELSQETKQLIHRELKAQSHH